MAHLEAGWPVSRRPTRSGVLFAKSRRSKKPREQSGFAAFARLLADLLPQKPRDLPRMAQIAASEKMGKALDILIGQL
jgi:hypothetical protein